MRAANRRESIRTALPRAEEGRIAPSASSMIQEQPKVFAELQLPFLKYHSRIFVLESFFSELKESPSPLAISFSPELYYKFRFPEQSFTWFHAMQY